MRLDVGYVSRHEASPICGDNDHRQVRHRQRYYPSGHSKIKRHIPSKFVMLIGSAGCDENVFHPMICRSDVASTGPFARPRPRLRLAGPSLKECARCLCPIAHQHHYAVKRREGNGELKRRIGS